jgi:hypothetical protein
VSYDAEYGMSWQKWITSPYNKGGFFADDGGVYVLKDGVNYEVINALLTQDIVANSKYYTMEH